MALQVKKKLNEQEVACVKGAIQAARAGKASLTQLAHAHDLAESAWLSGVTGELREHIHNMTPKPPMRVEAKSILLGIISGIFTHYLFRWAEPNGNGKIQD